MILALRLGVLVLGVLTSFSALAKDTTGGEENYEGSDPAMDMTPATAAPAGHSG